MVLKRAFDLVFSIVLLLFAIWIILAFCALAAIDTQSSGFFIQKRVGRYGKLFNIYKLRSINKFTGQISPFGKIIRTFKIDELPQLFNVLIGDMSFVGPRPDVPGYLDLLQGENRKILELKPGITSEASLKYVDEESIINSHPNGMDYYEKIIFPDKVRMYLEYYNRRSFVVDLQIITKTIVVLLKFISNKIKSSPLHE